MNADWVEDDTPDEPDEDDKAAAEAVGAGAGFPIERRAEGGAEAEGRLKRARRGAVHLRIEQAAHGEGLVAHGFRGEAEARAA